MSMLETFKRVSGHIYLDGELRMGTGTKGCESIDPATEETNGEITFTSVSEVDEAVAIAKKAQLEWSHMSALERAGHLHEVARAAD